MLTIWKKHVPRSILGGEAWLLHSQNGFSSDSMSDWGCAVQGVQQRWEVGMWDVCTLTLVRH